MKTIQHTLLATCLLVASTASANISIDTVLVGDAGNANDPNDPYGGISYINPYGGVGYDYHIGTYEVTNSQYTAFLNATAATDTHALYNPNMGASTHGGITRAGSSGTYTYSVKSGFGNKPVNFVSFWDAARFTNWLTSGDTETGVYNLNGTTAPSNNTITRDATAWNNGGVAVASENEWYKAAYYDGNGRYTLYPMQSNSITTADANYDYSVGTVTDVGTYGADPSHYGTFDQGGNLWEWNDTIRSTSNRVLRGGSYEDNSNNLHSSVRSSGGAEGEWEFAGFRVSSLEPIPEPSAYAAILGLFGLCVAVIRRR